MIERTDSPGNPTRVASRADETAESLRRIEASLARMEVRIAALESQATAAVGVATDSFDRLAADARARGVDVDARLRVALRPTSPSGRSWARACSRRRSPSATRRTTSPRA